MTSLNDYEQACLNDADHFTAVRGRGANRTVVKCAEMGEAERVAQKHGDGRTMIYAVTALDQAAHIKNA